MILEKGIYFLLTPIIVPCLALGFLLGAIFVSLAAGFFGFALLTKRIMTSYKEDDK